MPSASGASSSAGSAGSSPGAPGLPGREAGSNGRETGTSGGANGQRDTSSGVPGSQGSQSGGGGGDYSLDTLPDGAFGGDGTQKTGAMTPSERAQVLDDRLRKGYEDFDGLILAEREKNQREPEENPGGFGGTGGDSSGAGGGASGQPQTMPSGDSSMPTDVAGAPIPGNSAPRGETFPPPEDIPSGRDDDVVARQLREAAMREPDPVLREALWDEYRNYTGISESQ